MKVITKWLVTIKRDSDIKNDWWEKIHEEVVGIKIPMSVLRIQKSNATNITVASYEL